MNNNLLDDRNIESDNKSSFLVEIKGVELWLSVLSTLGFMLGLIFSLAGLTLFSLDNWSAMKVLMSFMAFLQGCLFFYWAYIGFKYTKSAKYYNPKSISKSLEDLLVDNSRLWRATAFLLFGFLCTIGVVLYGGLLS
jgi:hypothetical protein